MPEPAPVYYRYRLGYSRGKELRYVGHLDMQLVWERTIRRARLPVAFSQGFNPRPRFHMAAALPLGFTSRAEIIDIWLTEAVEPEIQAAQLQRSAPPGLIVDNIELIPLSLPAIQTQIDKAEYWVEPLETPQNVDVAQAVASFLAEESILRVWRKKTYDLRPLVHALEYQGAAGNEPKRIFMLLSAREGATARPEEVLDALGIDPTATRTERSRLILAAGAPGSTL